MFTEEDIWSAIEQATAECADDRMYNGIVTLGAIILGISEDTIVEKLDVESKDEPEELQNIQFRTDIAIIGQRLLHRNLTDNEIDSAECLLRDILYDYYKNCKYDISATEDYFNKRFHENLKNILFHQLN